jgi:VIT1/CCC1 family predicted Fe2+/Mn2+ transporter
MATLQIEAHRTQHIGWLRAAVLGANDGIVSTSSLIIGVAAASASHGAVMVAGVAGLVAGAMSMAAGEYGPSVRFVTGTHHVVKCRWR